MKYYFISNFVSGAGRASVSHAAQPVLRVTIQPRMSMNSQCSCFYYDSRTHFTQWGFPRTLVHTSTLGVYGGSLLDSLSHLHSSAYAPVFGKRCDMEEVHASKLPFESQNHERPLTSLCGTFLTCWNCGRSCWPQDNREEDCGSGSALGVLILLLFPQCYSPLCVGVVCFKIKA